MPSTSVSLLHVRFDRLRPWMDSRVPRARYEFHIRKEARSRYDVPETLFASSGNVIFADFYAARVFAAALNRQVNPVTHPERVVKAGKVNAMALIDELLHAVCDLYRETVKPDAFAIVWAAVEEAIGKRQAHALLLSFVKTYPPAAVHTGRQSAEDWLVDSDGGVPNALVALEELYLVRLANENPAFEPFGFLFDDADLRSTTKQKEAIAALERAFEAMPALGPDGETLTAMLRAPMRASPYSLAGQLDFMRRRWGMVLAGKMRKLLGGVDMLAEEDKPYFPGPGPTRALSYEQLEREYERFSEDKDWMPRVVMIAKSTLVWLDQLSRQYGRTICTLDAIPDEELDTLASRGFNALWLIGLWERSQASRRIKELCGNPEAAASAYSLFDYEIAGELGGWPALENLRGRAAWRGIRLAADMVPNHTGIDSAWVRERPELFIQRADPPFPSYSFTGEDLSGDGRIGIWLEDHYYDRRDAAVVFKRLDRSDGSVRYIYHGNDGTSMPWNDSAQIDFLKPEAREAVRERILHVARNFPIIRFDAAMIMARRHFRRLWYPEPGHGGDIASRGECSLPQDEFHERMPSEFWREVVDMCAREAPDTLLLAEAFWMMEGYFVRTLGMHRVYNSAFMNMLKNKENKKYRDTIKNTQEFDKDILKRFVNFMNNPDEETAVAQFGSGDHYFGVCTLMATLPGLPMFGHGQVEGLTEKYGMEYRRAYKDERPDEALLERHGHEVFPLLKKRYLFSGVDEFLLYDFFSQDGSVDENVFAYSNGYGGEHALVLFNNAWERSGGTVHHSCRYAFKKPDGGKELRSKTLAQGLGLFGSEGHFVIMREQRSGHWFIRSAKAMAEHGLFAILDGFKCQVFLDIRELSDNPSGDYGKLCSRLGGAGVPDFNAALQDVAFEELYRAWNSAFGKTFFSSFHRLAARPTAPTGAKTKAKKPKAESIDPQQGKLPFDIAETTGYFLPAAVPVRGFASCSLGFMTELAGATIDEDEREKRIAGCEKEAGRLFAVLGELVASSDEHRALRELMFKDETAVDAAAGLAALLCTRPLLNGDGSYGEVKALAERWSLDRKLREAMQAAGSRGDDAWLAASLAGTAAGLIDLLGQAEEARDGRGKAAVRFRSADAAAMVRALFDSEEGSRLLGAHLWDGITWFNQERFGAALSVLASALWLARGLDASAELKAIEDKAAEAGWAVVKFLERL